jgi:hypothetical protein
MAEKKDNIETKRLILLPAEQNFISQFSKKKYKKKFVLVRKEDPFVIAINEWPNNIILKCIFFIPLLIFILVTLIPFLVFGILLYYFNKSLSSRLFDQYIALLNFIAVTDNTRLINKSISEYATRLNNPNSELPFRRILYISETQQSLILNIDESKIFYYVDEIWLYDRLEDLYQRCILGKYDLNYSYIASNSQFVPNNLLNKKSNNSVDIAWLNDDNENIINAKKKILEREILISNAQKPRAPRIKLKTNNFLPPEIVYYFEPSVNNEVNSYLLENFDRINKSLNAKGMHFFYIPKLFSENEIINDELIDFVSYEFPDVFKGNQFANEELIKNVIQNVNSNKFSEGINLALSISDIDYPCFLHSVDYIDTKFEYRTFNYSVFNLLQEDGKTLEEKINYYLSAVNISSNDTQYRLVELDDEDPDETFNKIGQSVTDELSRAISAIKSLDSEKLKLASLVYIIKNLKDTQPELCENLNKVLYQTISNANHPISRLVIDEKHRILLRDYDNIEIELTPLPKTLFIFMLRHPEGVLLKELYLHRKELIDIYGEIGNRLDMSAIQKSIYEMTDARSNSINEKCSRIKEAFVSKIDESIARNYYITGSKSEPKSITLDRSLVIFTQRI